MRDPLAHTTWLPEEPKTSHDDDQTAYRDLFVQAPACYLVTDAGGTILEANQCAGRILGYPPEALRGVPLTRFLHASSWGSLQDSLARSAAGTLPGGTELLLIDREGRRIHMSVALRRGDGARANQLYWSLHDISVRARAEQALAHRASHDDLTGLLGLGMFRHLLGLAMARASREHLGLALLRLDLDRFKLVNDSLGHATGDEVLRETGVRLQAASRATDVVGRTGGDEFVVLLADLPLPDDGPAEARWEEPKGMMTRIRESLALPFLVSGCEIHMSASIGMGAYPAQVGTVTELMELADRDMYRAKRARPRRSVLLATPDTEAWRKLAGAALGSWNGNGNGNGNGSGIPR